MTSSTQNITQKILPNFLIVGAAKSGTSSLYQYLTQHPDIFMSKVKEPRFISSQFTPFPLNGPGDADVEAWYVKDFEKYTQLFEKAKGFQAIGEASADNLYFYQQAIPVIKSYLGNPKIVIILRDPIKRAFSAYQHMCRDNRENLTFADGLVHEEARIVNNWEFIYYYKAAGKYYQQVKAYLEAFDQVKVILNEDLVAHPQETLKDLLVFLGVSKDFTFNTSLRHNISGVPKSRWLHQLISNESIIRKVIRPFSRTLLSAKAREQLFHRMNKANLSKMEVAPPDFDLKAYFEEDVQLLAELLGRDLTSWTLKI